MRLEPFVVELVAIGKSLGKIAGALVAAGGLVAAVGKERNRLGEGYLAIVVRALSRKFCECVWGGGGGTASIKTK